MEDLPSLDIEAFAKWLVREDNADKKAIRQNAVKNGFKEAIANVPDAKDLGAEEIQFCEGWLYFALSELGGITNGDQLDAELKTRAERHLPPPGSFAPMTG